MVAGILLVRRLAAKQIGKFLPRVVGALVGQRGDVEFKFLQALLVQRKVHRTELELYADLFQIAGPGRHHPCATLVAVQVLQHKRLTFGVAQSTVTVLPAGVFEQLLRAAQVVAQAAVAIGPRRRGHRPKRGRWQLRPERLHQRQLGSIRQAIGLAIGVAKQALHPLVGSVKHLTVHPLVIQRKPQCLAHPHILELLAPGVEHIALKARGQAVFELSLDQFARVKLAPGHASRPVTSRKETHQIKFTGLQGFQPGGVVLVDLDGDAVEVGAAAAYIEVFGPVAGIAHIGDVLAKVDRTHPVRPAANRNVHHHLVKRLGLAAPRCVAFTPAVAEHRQPPHCQRQLPVGLLEPVADGGGIDHVHTGHIFELAANTRRHKRAVERVETVLHVQGQYRVAIVEARLGPQAEGGAQTITRNTDVLCQQAVARRRLVQRAHQQGVKHQAAEVGWCRAFDGKWVVFVER